MDDPSPSPALPDDLATVMPFAGTLGLEVEEATPEMVTASASWEEGFTTSGGGIHGGFLMGAADSVGAHCAFLNLPPATVTATIESKTNFFRPVRGGTITFVATPVHVGRSTIVVQTDATDDAGRLVSRTTQTQAVIAGGG